MRPGQIQHLSAQGTHLRGAVARVARKTGEAHQASHTTQEYLRV